MSPTREELAARLRQAAPMVKPMAVRGILPAWIAEVVLQAAEALSPQGEQKPVAYRVSLGGEWHYADQYSDTWWDHVVEPLYASPPDARREALEEAAQVAERMVGGFTAAITGEDEADETAIRDPDGPWVLNSDVAAAIRAIADASNPTGAK